MTTIGWIKVEDFKIVKVKGQIEVICWKDPQMWSLGGTMKDRLDLAKVLVGIPCSSLHIGDILSWGPNPKGKFSVASGYLELDR